MFHTHALNTAPPLLENGAEVRVRVKPTVFIQNTLPRVNPLKVRGCGKSFYSGSGHKRHRLYVPDFFLQVTRAFMNPYLSPQYSQWVVWSLIKIVL